ncbi:Carbohydrate diacid regulator [compost metagenome]
MRVTRKIADMIVKKTKELTQLNMNVIDTQGIIISSSDPERINTLHEGALEVVQSGQEIMITEENACQWAGTKPGVNMPIYFHTEMVGVIGISGHEAEVVPFGRAVKMMTELLLQHSYLAEQVEMKERSRTYLVQELIMKTEQTARESLYARGELLNVNLDLPRVILILQVDVKEELQEYSLQFKEIAKLFRNPKETLIAQLGRGRWIVMADTSSYKTDRHAKKELLEIASHLYAYLTEWFKADTFIAIGRACSDIEDFSASFNETIKMLDIARKQSKQTAILHVEDAAIELILSEVSEQSAQQLINQVLGKLVQHPSLLDSLQAFYDSNMNLSLAARVMGIHRNTLLYRLDRVEALIGDDPRQFQQAMRTQLGLLLYRIQETKE